MKIFINTATTYKGGGVQVAYSFIKECLNFPEHEYLVGLGDAISKLINQEEFTPNFTFFKIPYRPATEVLSFRDQARFFKKVEKEHAPDVVFTTSGPAYWRPSVPHVMGYNLPHYIYQDSPFFSIISWKERLEWQLKGLFIKYYTKRDADAYVVQTNDVGVRLKKWIGGNPNIYTVTNTYGNQYETNSVYQNLLPEKETGEYRFLMLSTYYLHKNFEIINDILTTASAEDKKYLRFVLTLPEETYLKIISPPNRLYVYNVGPVKPVDCPGLYRECDAIFLPTLLECFSATYAEAFKMKLPVVTTDLSFARTVCGDSALYFTPLSARSALEQIQKLYQSKQLQEGLIIRGISQLKELTGPGERAKKYLEICQSLIGGSLSS